MLYFPADPRGTPTDDEFVSLSARTQGGDQEARNELVVRNIGLAEQLSRRYRRMHPRHDAELLSEACYGLIKAAQAYKPTKGKFSTIAGYAINQRCVAYINEWRAKAAYSLSAMDGDEDRPHLSDPIDPKAQDPAAQAEQKDAPWLVGGAVAALPLEWRDLARRYYGVGCRRETFAEIAPSMGRDESRVREIIRRKVDPILKLEVKKIYGYAG